MKKTFLLLACTALLAASLTACGEGPAENKDTGSSASDSASAESRLSGTLDEKKDFMFVVTDEHGAAYEFTFDASAKPEGLDDVAEGDSVTVTYKGTVSEARPVRRHGHFGRKRLKAIQKTPAGTGFLSPRQGFSLFIRAAAPPCPDTSGSPPCGWPQ